MESLGKLLVGTGAVFLIIGLILWFFSGKLLWFGNLPGDIKIERPGFRLYAPLATMLLISIVASLFIWLFNKFFR